MQIFSLFCDGKIVFIIGLKNVCGSYFSNLDHESNLVEKVVQILPPRHPWYRSDCSENATLTFSSISKVNPFKEYISEMPGCELSSSGDN